MKKNEKTLCYKIFLEETWKIVLYYLIIDFKYNVSKYVVILAKATSWNRCSPNVTRDRVISEKPQAAMEGCMTS